MKTLVVSDFVLLRGNYTEVIEGLEYLEDYQKRGNNLVLMTNKPDNYIHIMKGYVAINKNIHNSLLNLDISKEEGLNIELFSDNYTLNNIKIYYDYNIIGNGIKVLDNNDNPVYIGDYLSIFEIASLIRIFKRKGYISEEECQINENKDSKPKYEFLSSNKGLSLGSNNCYGMTCSGLCSYYDDILIEEVEKENPELIGYHLYQKPSFFKRSENKLKAFKNSFIDTNIININDTRFILGDTTDDVFLKDYSELSYVIDDYLDGDNLRREKSLYKVLKNIDKE